MNHNELYDLRNEVSSALMKLSMSWQVELLKLPLKQYSEVMYKLNTINLKINALLTINKKSNINNNPAYNELINNAKQLILISDEMLNNLQTRINNKYFEILDDFTEQNENANETIVRSLLDQNLSI